MTQYDKDTLSNLIFCELHRMEILKQEAKRAEYTQGAEYWTKEIADLKQLDAVIWDEIK